MCGISGIISFKRSDLNLLRITAEMNRRIRHRGPDDEGFVAFDEVNYYTAGSTETATNAWDLPSPYKPTHKIQEILSANVQVVLGHRRLSIIDLSPAGHQPMCDSQGRYWLVFNGAIYNFQELKLDLINLGHTFYSHTDTEVLLHSYIAWGEECVNKFIGMWSFAIYDNLEKQLFASRDRIGVKPFYYTHDTKQFSFASEIKALTSLPFISKKINDTSVYDFLVLGKSEVTEESIFENIYELPPSHNLLLNVRNGKLKKWKYYSPEYTRQWQAYDASKNEEWVRQLQELLKDSIRLHVRTDAKIGACLSGGLDSSIITSLVAKEIGQIPVFTVTSKGDKEDESEWAKLIADTFKLNWFTTNPKPEDLIKNFEDFIRCQDMPCMSANSFTHYELMRLVNQQGVKVTVDGQGADELFAGYSPHYAAYILETLKNGSLSGFSSLLESSNDFAQKKLAFLLPLTNLASKFTGDHITSTLFRNKHPEFSFIKKDFWFSHQGRISLLKNKITSNLNATLFNDYHGTSLKTMLRVTDRNSMNFGIETRVPFADDHRLEEFAFSMPSSYKVKNNYSKAVLRESGLAWLPQEVCYRKDKKGFSIPEKRWLMEMGEEVFSYFDNSISPYLDVEAMKKNWMHTLSETENTGRIWRLLCLAVWIKTNNQ